MSLFGRRDLDNWPRYIWLKEIINIYLIPTLSTILYSQRGKQRAFRLGEFLRRRYNKLLGEKYSAKNIFVQSTDVDRTLMSAQLVSKL